MTLADMTKDMNRKIAELETKGAMRSVKENADLDNLRIKAAKLAERGQ